MNGSLMIITLGGLPTGEAIEPMLSARINMVRTCTGFKFVTSQIRITTGVIINMVETLSRKSADTMETKLRLHISGHTFPFVF